MTPREIIQILLRRWWLIVLVPVVMAPLLVVKARMQPYQVTVRASVLLPGDTEIPGNSERPELMVMDDLPALIGSQVFSDAVATNLSTSGATFDAKDVQGSISGSRYSRIVTIVVTRNNAGEARAIANAAAAVLPGIVNQFLVAPNTTSATVQIIDPPGEATRARPHQRFIFVALLGLGAAAGAGLALLAHGWSAESTGTIASPQPQPASSEVKT